MWYLTHRDRSINTSGTAESFVEETELGSD